MSLFSTNKPNVILFLDDNEYLSANCENPAENGFISGKYYGSSSRISGGEIFNPKFGYSLIKITLKIFQDDNWVTIFEETIDSREKLIDEINVQCAYDIKSFSRMKLSEKNLKHLVSHGAYENNDIIEKIKELDKLDEIEKIEQIEKINELYNLEMLRCFEEQKNNNIKIIMEGRESPYFVDKIHLNNEKYNVILNLRDLHRFNGEVQISGCSFKLI